MTPKLDPEIKALRALERAWAMIPEPARQRCLEWFVASHLDRPPQQLPKVKQ